MNKSEVSTINYNLRLDTSGLLCPTPIIHTKQALSSIDNHEVLLIIATDPSFSLDCEVFVRQSGHVLLQSWQEHEKFYFLLQKNQTSPQEAR